MKSQFSEGLPRKNDSQRLLQDEEDVPLRSLRRTEPEDRLTSAFAHWGGFLSWILAPLILYLAQQNRRSLAAWHAREAFNFQLSLLIYYVVPLPILCLGFIDFEWFPILLGIFLLVELLIILFEFIVVIWASVAAYHGNYFHCPMNIPFIPRPEINLEQDDDPY